MKKAKKKAIALALAAILAGLAFCACDVRLKTVSYTIENDKLKAPVRLALVTDLHACAYGDGQQTLLSAIAAQSPDAVLLGGDIFDDVRPPENTYVLLRALAAQYPCYYVAGNHEFWSGQADEYKQWLREQGVTVLAGDCAVLEVGGETVNICGVDDPSGCTGGGFDEQLRRADDAANDAHFTVLLSHRPERIDVYRQYRFDLVLAGHAHGGQWRLPGILNGLYTPNQGLFPDYAGGAYVFEDAILVVSRGLARFDTPIPRIFNRPELVIVELISC